MAGCLFVSVYAECWSPDCVSGVMRNRLRFLLLWCLVISLPSVAAVPVDDIGQRRPENVEGTQPSAVALSPIAVSSNAPPPLEAEPADAYTKLQLLQDEVMQLRGLVEELSNEIRQLKQRQMDDYMDLDRRLSGGAALIPGSSVPDNSVPGNSVSGNGIPGNTAPGNGTPGNNAGDSAVQPPTSPGASVSPTANASEVKSYNNAYGLLKAGKVDPSVAAFKQHIDSYPNGSYTANSYYWLGEIYLLKNNLEEARQAFATVADSFPAHRKAADATFKLGKVYHMQGNDGKAKALLKKVAEGTGSAAPLAQKYLADNF